MQAFLLRATGQAPDLATIQAQVDHTFIPVTHYCQTGEGKDKMIELLAPHGTQASVKAKYYFMIDKIKAEGDGPVC